ncbi:MAG: type II toxin-antitoxin system PemK/MazF family toxin, partial [bacterium]|nr:type II toxin-antitoxin system PemK/MazF family toxin [bacterium]
MAAPPSRGELWHVDLNPTRGHEQAGRRPGLIVSVDPFNRGPAGLVVVVPVTSKRKGVSFHVAVDPPEGGLSQASFIKCEDVRSISRSRLARRLGKVSAGTLADVEDRLRILVGLQRAELFDEYRQGGARGADDPAGPYSRACA